MDTKALATLSSMGRTHASYKLTHGLAKSFHDKTLKNLKENYFSLNIDESGSTNNQKILTILVSYYCEEVKHIVIEHLASVSLVKVDSASLFKVLVEIFKDYDLNWNNLCSILMDSCAVMRGSKTGLEKRIRTQKCHHLLDIDGDVCHHCHNGTKRFCAPFENHLENLFYYLYNHFKWSTDLRKYLSDICDILYIKFTMPDRFLKHRWLSVYDVTMSTNRLYEAYFVFFFSCIPDKDKRDYKDLLNKIYVAKHVDEDGKSKIKVIQSEIKKKKLTKSGAKRRDSIVNLLIIQEQKTKLVLGFYSAALPIFKRYVCLFQSKNPLVHKLNDEQLRAFKEILNCFFKIRVH
ncbi:unnamed protein product [Meganyctiphanes norvegica]|uniref:DUF4371 domain-containing protein n=1 Tax=Meganyctiphanes norvegica TaxID=48144 RepID=A0AAV2PZ30_MEGNR